MMTPDAEALDYYRETQEGAYDPSEDLAPGDTVRFYERRGVLVTATVDRVTDEGDFLVTWGDGNYLALPWGEFDVVHCEKVAAFERRMRAL